MTITTRKTLRVALACLLTLSLSAVASSTSVAAYDDDGSLWNNDLSANAGDGVNSQDYTTPSATLYSHDAKDDEAADDFLVTRGRTWTITGVRFIGNELADSYNIRVYVNDRGRPGSLVAERTKTLAWMYTASSGATNVTADPAIVLPAGRYWLSVQANQDGLVDGEWTWANGPRRGRPAMWRQPANGFGSTACTSWGARSADCGFVDGDQTDQRFLLTGTATQT